MSKKLESTKKIERWYWLRNSLTLKSLLKLSKCFKEHITWVILSKQIYENQILWKMLGTYLKWTLPREMKSNHWFTAVGKYKQCMLRLVQNRLCGHRSGLWCKLVFCIVKISLLTETWKDCWMENHLWLNLSQANHGIKQERLPMDYTSLRSNTILKFTLEINKYIKMDNNLSLQTKITPQCWSANTLYWWTGKQSNWLA